MTGLIEVRLLGGIELRCDQKPVSVTDTKLRAIIAMLALGSPHPVSDERLIEELWGENPPAHPANALQGQMSTLRRMLGRDAVERRGAGYVLALGPDDVDTIRLERLVRAGREAQAHGDAAGCQQALTAALALVRGPALDGLADYDFARVAASRLDELVIGARETLIDAQLALGAHAEALSVLTGLVRAHPMRERFHAQLVTALYRCGRQADALRAYQEARQALIDELGVEPGPELKALEAAVLAHDP